jgi:flagellar biosynthesis protein FlhG
MPPSYRQTNSSRYTVNGRGGERVHTREGERTYNTILKACQNFLKFAPPLAGIVRRDQKVRDAIRNQTPLLVRSPGSDAAKDVNNIAAKLFAQP